MFQVRKVFAGYGEGGKISSRTVQHHAHARKSADLRHVFIVVYLLFTTLRIYNIGTSLTSTRACAVTTITRLLAAGLLTWLTLLVLLVVVRMLRGDIGVSGFLAPDKTATAVAPERVVAMVAFPFVLLTYLMTALHADLSVVNGRPIMPDVPDYLLTILTGGNGLYLAGKISRT